MWKNKQPINNSQQEMLQLNRYKKDKVTVRVWTSSANMNNPMKTNDNEEQSCGHVSVETGGVYMSLWPNTPPSKGIEGMGVWKKIVTPEFKSSYQSDVEAETHENAKEPHTPEVVIHFYTFNKTAILEKFEQLKKECGGWSMLGLKNSESCASAAWLLLKAGDEKTNLLGVGKQLSTSSSQSSKGGFFSSINSSSSQSQQSSNNSVYSVESAVLLFGIKSPDMLSEMLKKAKMQELKQAPLTKQLDSEQEIPNQKITKNGLF